MKHMPFKALLLGLTLLSFPAQGQDLTQLQMDVAFLASDLLEGRETGTRGEVLAADYIARRFEALGLQPKGENGSWYHSFAFKYSANPHAADEEKEERQGKNVLGFLDNGAATTVVIGAHYDHLGYGIVGSLYAGSDSAIHNGADDNASGVAAILRLAALLKESPATHNNYLFMAFSGEELGLFGSKSFVDDPTIDLAQINYVLNLDMVGRLKAEKVLVVNGHGTSPAWKPALEQVNVAGITTTGDESGMGPSDHTSFYVVDLPVLHFFTGQHSQYHKPSDDSHLINYPGLSDVSDFILALIEALDDEGKLAFTPTKDKDNTRTASSFKVTLGVMPDYVYSGEGLKLDGVKEDRPAAVAGLKRGDIVIRIGDIEINDIYAYMEALGKFVPGQQTTIVFKRGEEVIEKELRF